MFNSDYKVLPSFPISNRFYRLIWNITYLIFFRFSPKPLFKWRIFLLKIFGSKIGKNVRFYPFVQVWSPKNITVGDNSILANYVTLYSQGEIIIGSRSVISQGVHLCSGTHDYTRQNFPLITKSINVGNDVWIAAESFIHPGVKIANGAVIGARSVVIKDIQEWSVNAGNPCVFIKKRLLLE
jgi:putative colanic acid biosynthesis acetyltransferase WcaF